MVSSGEREGGKERERRRERLTEMISKVWAKGMVMKLSVVLFARKREGGRGVR